MSAKSLLLAFKLFDRDGVGATLLDAWYYTDNERDLTAIPGFAGITFLSTPLSVGEVRHDSEQSSGAVEFRVPLDNPVAGLYVRGTPYGRMQCSVYSVDAEGVVEPLYMGGIVRGADFKGIEAAIKVDSIKSRLTRRALRVEYRSACWKALYSADAPGTVGTGCGVDSTAYTHAGVITALSADGRTVTTSLAEADSYFRSGLFYAGGQVRMVLANTGGVLTLISAIPGLAVGDAVTAKKGCDRSDSAVTGCKSFSNYTRFGGHPTVPNSDPWSKPLAA